MKSVICKRDPLWRILLCVLALLLPATAAADVPGQISFQGYLTDDEGAPVPDDTYSMHFYLFDAPTGGTQLWNDPDGEVQAVTVTNGVYNVQLGAVESLDSSMFNGGVAWLQVVVEGEVLSPRQRITAAAYALKAGDADTFAGNAVVDLDARYVQEGETGAVNSAMIADGAISAADLGANSVGASEIGSSAVGTAEVADNSLTFEDILDGPGSKLSADVLDDLDSTAFFILNQNETVTGRPAFNGGTTGATPPFSVDSTTLVANLNADYLDGLSSGSFIRSTSDYGRSGVSSTLYEGTESLTSKYLNESGDSMSVSTAGTALSVTNTGSGYALSGRAEGSSGRGLYANASATGAVSNYGVYSIASGDTGRAVYAWANASGDVQNYGVYGIASGDDGRGIYGSGSGDHGRGVKGDASGDYGIGVQGYASNSGNFINYGGHFQANGEDARAVYGWAYHSGDSAQNYGGYFRSEGEQGRGVYGLAYGDNSYGVYGVSYGTAGSGGYFYGSNIGLTARGGTWAAEFQGNVRLRNPSTLATIMELGEGLDYAEGFDVSDTEKPSPGSVLIIDPDNPGKLKLSESAYDSKVAGIVAGANGLGSGVRLGADRYDNDVALAGRVFCKVDATLAAVKTGDLLTTADLPGYAMKACDDDRAKGAILGKAMQDLEKGEKGQILVLVTLQ